MSFLCNDSDDKTESGAERANAEMSNQDMRRSHIWAVDLQSSGTGQARKQPGCRGSNHRKQNRPAAQHKPYGHGGRERNLATCPEARPTVDPEMILVMKRE